jgi:hypothetical protein
MVARYVFVATKWAQKPVSPSVKRLALRGHRGSGMTDTHTTQSDFYADSDPRKRSSKHANVPKPQQRRTEVLKFRCSMEELLKLDIKALQNGMSLSDYVRRAALGLKLEPRNRQRDELIYELNRIGNNLNQLTKLAHQERLSGVELSTLEVLVARVHGELDKVLQE